GGAIIVWDDARLGTSDLQVYAQRLDGSGNALWPVGPDPKAPIPIATGAANQRIPVAVPDGAGGVVAAWADSRNGTNLDLFASRVFAGGALPVSLLRFDASASGWQALLQWETAFESNIKAYAVERSADGRRFEQIGRVSAANAASARYQFTDRQPLSGANYYRLQTLELDGSSSLSRVLKLNFAPRTSGVLRLWPNPIKDRLNLELTNLANGAYQVRAIDASGRIASQTMVQVANGQLSQSLAASQLPLGIFTLQVIDASGKTVAQEKVIRQ
ncbi:MAG: T9SS type A sorting domain-containing protein, partial [Chitinophagaceae bacterium]|nr:T9SS type A sorting domain-containing protein [Chitinophagaceae bacterium]